MYDVLCEVDPLEFCDVLLGQRDLCKWHDIYESRYRTMIVSFGDNLYRILEVACLSQFFYHCEAMQYDHFLDQDILFPYDSP